METIQPKCQFSLLASMKRLNRVFRIFPNPSDGLITIEVLEITGNEKVEVRDLHGRLIQSRAITSNSTQLNLGNMASVFTT